MANIIIERKRARIRKIRAFVEAVKKEKKKLNKEKIINWLIIEECVSRTKAKEEVEAVIDYDD